ncbi:RNA polymerase sigma factor [Niabella aquatica]
METVNVYTDKEWFALIAEGDETAFRHIFEDYTRSLRPFLLKMDATGFLMEEVIQETMLKVWLRRDQLPLVEYPRSWVFKKK